MERTEGLKHSSQSSSSVNDMAYDSSPSITAAPSCPPDGARAGSLS